MAGGLPARRVIPCHGHTVLRCYAILSILGFGYNFIPLARYLLTNEVRFFSFEIIVREIMVKSPYGMC